MWKMHSRLNGTGKLHGSRLGGMLEQEQLLQMIYDLQQLSAQASSYARFDNIYVSLKQLNRDKRGVVLA